MPFRAIDSRTGRCSLLETRASLLLQAAVPSSRSVIMLGYVLRIFVLSLPSHTRSLCVPGIYIYCILFPWSTSPRLLRHFINT